MHVHTPRLIINSDLPKWRAKLVTPSLTDVLITDVHITAADVVTWFFWRWRATAISACELSLLAATELKSHSDDVYIYALTQRWTKCKHVFSACARTYLVSLCQMLFQLFHGVLSHCGHPQPSRILRYISQSGNTITQIHTYMTFSVVYMRTQQLQNCKISHKFYSSGQNLTWLSATSN